MIIQRRVRPRIRQFRPIVVTAGSEAIQLYQYKQSSGSGTNSGWSKQYLAQYLDPFVWGDISAAIGSQTWEVGVNIFCSTFYGNGTSYAGTGGYGGSGTYTETASTTVSYAIKALDKNEAIQGTIWQGSYSTSDYHLISITGLMIVTQTCIGAATWTGGGSWTGSLNAFLLDMTWSGSVATTLTPPIVGGLTATAGATSQPSYVNV